MKPPSIVIDHFLSTKWSKKLFTINHYELQNGKCIVTQELSAYEYRRANCSRAVKKTLSIPEWLNEAAIRENINFSQILQEALMVKLGILQTRF